MIFKKIFHRTEKAEIYLSVVLRSGALEPNYGIVLFLDPWGGVILGIRLTFWRWFFHVCIIRSLKLSYMLNAEKTGLADHMKAHRKYIKKEAPNRASD